MKTYGIYSAGGFGREIRRLLQGQIRGQIDPAEIVFIDDSVEAQQHKAHGSRVVSLDEFLEIEGDKTACVAFADSELRQRKVERLAASGISFQSVLAPTAVIGDQVSIGEGAVFADYTIVTCDAVIGRHFHCNIYSYVAHDCVVGDYVTLAPRVSLNGRISVGDHAYIGSDATFLPGSDGLPLQIGEGAVIGAGAVVTKDVPPGAVVVGNPARPLPSKAAG